MSVTIIDSETDEEVGEITDEGYLETEDEFLQETAIEMTEEGGMEILVPGGTDDELSYGEWRITPEDEGFKRAFIEYLPFPYTAEAEVLRDLPSYKPPAEEYPGGTDRRTEGEAAEKFVEHLTKSVSKEWVKDPSEEAQTMRWRNTETGEYRYQENQPGSGEGGADEEPSQDEGAPEEAEPLENDRFIEDGLLLEEPHDYSQFEEADQVYVYGQVWDLESESLFEGPAGMHRARIQLDDGNVMTPDARDLDGVVIEDFRDFELGDYEVETEWGAKFADAINTGEWSERGADSFMGVRDIQHHASDVENPDVLGDAIREEMDSRDSPNAIRSMKSRIRALGADPSDYLPESESVAAGFTGERHEEWPELYDPEETIESTQLSEMDDVEPGVTARNMYVQELPDGSTAFKSEYGEGALSERYRDEILVVGTFAKRAGLEDSIPPIAASEDGEWIAMEEFGDGTEAEEISNMPSSWADEVDGDELLDKLGVMGLAGANDLHHNNMMVSEEGEIGFHDLDHSLLNLDQGSEKYYAVSCAADTATKILAHQDFEQLPSQLQERLDEDWFEEEEDWDLANRVGDARKFKERVHEVISKRVREQAKEIWEDVEGDEDALARDYLRVPDVGYENNQSRGNSTIVDNIRMARTDYVDMEEE